LSDLITLILREILNTIKLLATNVLVQLVYVEKKTFSFSKTAELRDLRGLLIQL
jgi:hypothetical protein